MIILESRFEAEVFDMLRTEFSDCPIDVLPPITFVEVDEGRVIATICIDFAQVPTVICNFTVIRELRGQGVGSRLLAKAHAFIKKRNSYDVQLLCEDKNMMFYEKRGYSKDGYMISPYNKKRYHIMRHQMMFGTKMNLKELSRHHFI